jgi:hypothetical protein
MKNFKNAYKYYSKLEKITKLKKEELENKVLSFLYSQNLEDYNYQKNSSGALIEKDIKFINSIKEKIKTFKLEKEEEFYYINSLECISNFHNCKLNFENYFKNTNYS